MNKKQLLAAWITVILICVVIFFAPKDYLVYSGQGRISRVGPTDQFAYRAIVKIKWDKVVQRSLILFFLGAMVIYTLSREEDKEKIKKTVEAAIKSKPGAKNSSIKKKPRRPKTVRKKTE